MNMMSSTRITAENALLCLLLTCTNTGQCLNVTYLSDVSNVSNHVINATVSSLFYTTAELPAYQLNRSDHVELSAEDCRAMNGHMQFFGRSGSVSLSSASNTEAFNFSCRFTLFVPKSIIVKVTVECVGLLCGVLPQDPFYAGYFLRHEQTYGIVPGKVTLFHAGSLTVSIERRVHYFQGTFAECFLRQCRLPCIDRTKYVIGADNRRSCLLRPFYADFRFATYPSHSEDGFEVYYTSKTHGAVRRAYDSLNFQQL